MEAVSVADRCSVITDFSGRRLMKAATQAAEPGLGHSPGAVGTRLTPLLDAELALDPAAARKRAGLLSRVLALTDIASGLLAGSAGALAGDFAGLGGAFGLLVGASWLLVAFAGGLYATDDLCSWSSGIAQGSRLAALAVLVSWPMAGAAALLGAGAPLHAALLSSAVLLVLTPAARAGARAALHRMTPLRQRTLILGSGHVANQLVDRLARHPEYGLEAIGLVDDDVHRLGPSDLPVLGSFADLCDVLRVHAVDRVIIAFSRASHEVLLSSIRACREQRVALDVVPRLFEFLEGARSLEQIGGLPLMSIGPQRLSRSAQVAKRAFDVVAAGVMLMVLAPLLAAIALLVKLESRGPVFFRQARAGHRGAPFRLLKFRTMAVDADERKEEIAALNDLSDDVMFKVRRDPRVTRVGRVLRRLSLDEVPQLVNVVRGEMSLVGPRPLVLPESERLGEGWHARRFDLRPGLTGPWQISGRSDLSVHEMVRLDFQYVTGWSLGRDLAILAATLPAVLVGRGAY